ncbi:S41 family peptidase [Gluconacetobacter diazotrophicus]|uniref:Carboxy-terminal processing protease n=1 Tax=Gluconacetobacter diazotrophicus (strain ATCC 49037 / DSM 5601 / CCUG 37298 / CIP 103539 / LMG 7603 / PAl5) TaxID=272568 RepID=A9GZP9_GLUDA|nr:S41 family peptidase [Gluconacetobacter diazotrophicus]CAP53986.1 Carboxy-terminal processing protease [Gluconacetobacter diazotrophicus PA1 5]
MRAPSVPVPAGPVSAGWIPAPLRGAGRRVTSVILPTRTIAIMLIVIHLMTPVLAPVAARAAGTPAPPPPPRPAPTPGQDTRSQDTSQILVQADPVPQAGQLDADMTISVVNAALTFLLPRTLESHTPRDFCLWGLNGLSAIDPSLTVVEQRGPEQKGANQNGIIQLSLGQEIVLRLPAPPDSDQAGWTDLTVRLMQAAWARSGTVRGAGADGLMQSFFDELFNHMDPYSRYVAPSPATTDRDTRTGGEAGTGLTLGRDARSILITGVNANGPAWPAGLATGQRLYAVNGRSTRDQTPGTVAQWLLGAPGSTVTVTVGDGRARRTVTLRRASVPPETVFAYAAEHMVVIRVTAFSADTAQEMSQYLDQASDDQHLRGLVLDLRGNRGGVLQQAVTASALVLDQGVAAITHGRDPEANHVWAVQGGDMTGGVPIVVLVDGRTASAAEILAASLADHRRAVVVGSATLGKGLVQTIGQMPDGGELFVTWSRVLAPLGWPLQGLGVMPQVCTSRGESDLERQLQDLAAGQVDMRDAVQATRATRYPVPVSRILDLRRACPAAIGTDSDLDAARSLIDNPAEYRAALSAIPEESPYAPQAE